jgi:hypothetical protein
VVRLAASEALELATLVPEEQPIPTRFVLESHAVVELNTRDQSRPDATRSTSSWPSEC